MMFSRNGSRQSKHDKVKYRIAKINAREKATASETYAIRLKSNIGQGPTRTKLGIGKKIATIDNVSASNLGLDGDPNPRMLARQVASWKVARGLDVRVLSNEKYALHKQGLIRTKETLVGVSAMVPNAQSLSSIIKKQIIQLESEGKTGIEIEDYLGEHLFTPSIQKQLSDLQLIDALTGQTDRHHGNIFIDMEGSKVYGIDNDQAFVNTNTQNRERLNYSNSAVSWLIPTKIINQSKYGGELVIDMQKKLKYTQQQIDSDTAEKILAMTPEKLTEILQDRVGKSYGEYLTDDEIYATLDRLEQMKIHINRLKADNKLINTWGNKTYRDSYIKYGEVVSFLENQNMGVTAAPCTRYQNYIAREIYSMVHRLGPAGKIIYYENGSINQVKPLLRGDNAVLKESGDNSQVMINKYFSRNDALRGIKGDGELSI